MSTPRDLAIAALDVGPGRHVEAGSLALALAGAELIDLLGAGVLTLDGDRIVPGAPGTPADPLLDEAAAAVVRQAPHERVEDWLWRRGRGLSAVYLAALESEGQVTKPRHRWMPGRIATTAPTDSPARRRAADRLASGEPVLAVLAAAAGIEDGPAGDLPGLADEAVETVLAAVGDAVTELEAVRQRRSIENAAFDNIWRGP
ncbi:GPP34 family phosphoprotein [Streptomyces sp. CRN 30]|uniref:GPP34 family phosphoprotein n=1 Tax=Streptomyces sp. CRN 30 TaxID=3075613 RepID=UPI002A83FB20|nr:GPP34 family phosphoprotein [Streptomyces sp. CRN 30]